MWRHQCLRGWKPAPALRSRQSAQPCQRQRQPSLPPPVLYGEWRHAIESLLGVGCSLAQPASMSYAPVHLLVHPQQFCLSTLLDNMIVEEQHQPTLTEGVLQGEQLLPAL
jgi:hypothetical protein